MGILTTGGTNTFPANRGDSPQGDAEIRGQLDNLAMGAMGEPKLRPVKLQVVRAGTR